MTKNYMTLDIQRVDAGEGNRPGTVVGIDVDSGEQREVKAFSELLTQFEAGKTFHFEWYLGKEWQGRQDMVVSKHGAIKEVQGAVDKSNGSQGSSDDPAAHFYQKEPSTTQTASERAVEVSAPPRTTPQAIMVGSQNLKERSITVLAVMKSVIESGGTEADFERWLAKHDLIVLGK
jgi:hypothetical protein